MHARTVRTEGPPESYDRTRQLLDDQVIPALQQLPGFQGAYWVGSREAGKGIGFFFYSDADKLKETADRAQQLRGEAVQAAGGNITEVKEHEVVVDTGEKIHDSATHMRVTTLRADPGRRADGIARINDTVIPQSRQIPGFLGGFWLSTLDGREVLACTLWDGAASLEGSRPVTEALRGGAASATGSEVVGVEEFEIVARAKTPAAAGT